MRAALTCSCSHGFYMERKIVYSVGLGFMIFSKVSLKKTDRLVLDTEIINLFLINLITTATIEALRDMVDNVLREVVTRRSVILARKIVNVAKNNILVLIINVRFRDPRGLLKNEFWILGDGCLLLLWMGFRLSSSSSSSRRWSRL
ncbi:hypothetical protein N7478_008204 [Penicillium angulare]|uniref:uncharacterized protein n=1 Tax=Penicillium angulare TaxID=116970 RepID=UPI00254175D3|nr:uncharacterized protein N7478_008204 [Penicillium angulare]KAJ5273079.1 hypothetical protein N7478_008204 [Penicillium angulare]